jgi:hypothetical protein
MKLLSVFGIALRRFVSMFHGALSRKRGEGRGSLVSPSPYETPADPAGRTVRARGMRRAFGTSFRAIAAERAHGFWVKIFELNSYLPASA